MPKILYFPEKGLYQVLGEGFVISDTDIVISGSTTQPDGTVSVIKDVIRWTVSDGNLTDEQQTWMPAASDNFTSEGASQQVVTVDSDINKLFIINASASEQLFTDIQIQKNGSTLETFTNINTSTDSTTIITPTTTLSYNVGDTIAIKLVSGQNATGLVIQIAVQMI